ncbi:MAG TPA: hypothetical protein DCS30_02575 [Rhizobiales bacterium]|nr:hypothetical protein [Hyphomicrobiales bacterium]
MSKFYWIYLKPITHEWVMQTNVPFGYNNFEIRCRGDAVYVSKSRTGRSLTGSKINSQTLTTQFAKQL